MINQRKKKLFSPTPLKSPSPDFHHRSIIPSTKSPKFGESENKVQIQTLEEINKKSTSKKLYSDDKVSKEDLEKKNQKQQNEKLKPSNKKIMKSDQKSVTLNETIKKSQSSLKHNLLSSRQYEITIEQKDREIIQLKSLLKNSQYFNAIRQLQNQNKNLKQALSKLNIKQVTEKLNDQNRELKKKLTEAHDNIKILTDILDKYRNMESQDVKQLKKQNTELKKSLEKVQKHNKIFTFDQKDQKDLDPHLDQINSLNQQKRFYQKHLSELESNYNLLFQQLRKARKQNEQLEKTNKEFKNTTTEAKKIVTSIQRRVVDEKSTIKKQQPSVSDFNDNQMKYLELLHNKDQEIKKLIQQIRRLIEQNNRLEQQLRSLGSKIHNISQQFESSIEIKESKQIIKLQQQIENLRDYMGKYRNSKNQDESSSSQSTLQSLIKQNLQLSEKIRIYQKKITQLQNTNQRNQQTRKQIEFILTQNKKLKYQISSLRSQIEFNKKGKNEFELRLNTLIQQNNEYERNLKKFKQEKVIEIENYIREIEMLKQKLHNQDSENQHIRDQLIRTKQLLESCDISTLQHKINQGDRKKYKSLLVFNKSSKKQIEGMKRQIVLLNELLIQVKHQNQMKNGQIQYLNKQKESLFDKACSFEKVINTYISNVADSLKQIQIQSQDINQSVSNSVSFTTLQNLRETLKKIQHSIQNLSHKIQDSLLRLE